MKNGNAKYSSKTIVTYHYEKKGNNSNIDKKNYQCGNKASMFETVKEVDENIVTKENNIYSTREPTASLLSDNVE